MSAALAAAALLVGAGGGFALGRTTATGTGAAAEADDHDHEPGSIEAVAEELAAEQASERAALNVELVEAARTAHDQLSQVLRAMAAAVPVDGAAAGPSTAERPTAADAASWAADADEAEQVLAAVPEGHAEFNVTRQALLTSATLLSDAVTDFSRALASSDDTAEAVAEAAAQRDAAVQLWLAGAAQLDGLVVEAGQPHVHLFLDPGGDPDAVPLEFQEPDGS